MPRQDIEKKYPPRAKGISDGLNNEPPSDATEYTNTESEYRSAGLDHVRKNIEDAQPIFNEAENLIDSTKSKIMSNSFSSIPIDLQTNYSSSTSSFKQSFNQDYDSWKSANTDLQIFKDTHELQREPVIKKDLYIFASLALMATLIIIEIIANTQFLKTALLGGEVEGRALSISIAAINVGVSFLVGVFIVRNINHNDTIKRNLGIFLTTLYVIFFIWLNCSLGVFRTDSQENMVRQSQLREEIPRDAFIEIGKSSMQPWNHLSDLNPTGWALIILGCTFAVLGLIDGYKFNDTYPGYGNIGKKEFNRRKKIQQLISAQRNNIVNLYKNSSLISKNTNKLDLEDIEIWAKTVNTFQLNYNSYQDMMKNWEEDINHCISEYRQFNKQNRTASPPEYFNNPFKFSSQYYESGKVFASMASVYMEDEDRSKMKTEMINLNQEYYQKCTDDFEKLKNSAEEGLERNISGFRLGV